MFTIRVYTYNDEPLIDYLQLQSKAFLRKTIFDIKEVDGVDLLKVSLAKFTVKFPAFLNRRLSYIVFNIIDSDLIQNCPHFDNGPNVDIFVPPLYLTRFVKVTRVEITNHPCSCCPRLVRKFLNRNFKFIRDRLNIVIHVDIDGSKFPMFWEEAGYPMFLGEPEDPERVSHWLVLSNIDMNNGKPQSQPGTYEAKAPSLLALLNRLYLHDKTFNMFNAITGVTTDGATFDMLLVSIRDKLQKEFGLTSDEAMSAVAPVKEFIQQQQQKQNRSKEVSVR